MCLHRADSTMQPHERLERSRGKEKREKLAVIFSNGTITWNGFRRDALSARLTRFNVFTVADVRNTSRARFQIAPPHLNRSSIYSSRPLH